MKNTKGLSTVVTTLIIVLLVLAAIGIIWTPIKNLLTQSSESFDQTKCFDMDVSATKVLNSGGVAATTCLDLDTGVGGECNSTAYGAGCDAATCSDGDPTTDSTSYNVTLSRKLSGEDSIGAKIIFFSDTDASGNIDFGEFLTSDRPIITKTIDGAITGATKVRVYPYYLDEATQEEKLCDTSNEFTFSFN